VTLSAVLLDMDGLLVDTEPVWTVAEVELARQLGGEFTPDLKAAIVGTRLEVAVPTILRWYGGPTDDATVARTMAWLLGRMVELSEEYQLTPEQSTSAIIAHHPEAKYFAAR
jgi:beta-phosphoglucomutase-like phosphatase (HAD superfamily)